MVYHLKHDYTQARVSTEQRAMLDFVAKITRHHHEATPADIERLRQVGFSDAKILYIILWTANFNLANTITDSMGLEYHENFSSGLTMFFADGAHKPDGELAHVPALTGAPLEWLNSQPLTGFDVRDRPIHVTYMDLTHPNSLLLLPHLERWQREYGPRGLVILAVHTGEFPTAKDPAVARAEVARLGITIPLVLDPDYRAIAGANNRYWPAQHLVDRRGYTRYRHYGPGGEDIVGHYLVHLLSEDQDFNAQDLPPPSHVSANPWLHPEATPELYAGFRFGSHRAGGWGSGDTPKVFKRPAELEAHRLYLEGTWHVCDDHVALAGGQGLASFRYTARRAGLFASPGTAQWARWRVRLDGMPVPFDQSGEDLSPGSELNADQPRFYWLTRHRGLETHQIDLVTEDPGARLHRVCFLPFRGEVE